jgi:putative transposase
VRRAFKFRLFTNANQERELGIMLETHRRLYNLCLEQRRDLYRQHKHAVRYIDQSAEFKDLRSDNTYFARLNFSSAQATMRRLDKSFVAFFRRVNAGQKPGYPRFKARDRFDSIEFPTYGDGIRLNDNRLRVQHVGVIRCKIHRPVEGIVKTATLKREGDKWFVVLSCDLGDVHVEPSILPAVGIDIGLENFLTTSDGEVVENPRFLKKELPALRRAQRAVSRKKKGGVNRCKATKVVRVLHAHVANQRREHHHKTALNLIRCYGLIAVESLNIRGMVRNHRLSRAIADAAWGGFLMVLGHKAERAGVTVMAVNARGTSQQCSACGEEVRKNLSVRQHVCPHCGLSLHRDENAARNILARGLDQAGMRPVGANGESPVSQEAVCFS